ncbi:hypothetical protein [Nostoc piscinale]|uniref:hypothetical protein n=1 Tax=Nostoc piscinale TaxID=224012 RepID=UPI000A5834AF|nr:hypothetical protein [Nostoc piscinale]
MINITLVFHIENYFFSSPLTLVTLVPLGVTREGKIRSHHRTTPEAETPSTYNSIDNAQLLAR